MRWAILAGVLFLAGCGPKEEAVLTWRVWVQLTEASDLPTLEEIRPYREALIAHEYEIRGMVVDHPEVEAPPARIAVYHWAIRDGEATDAMKLEKGDHFFLEIQAMSDRPDLKGRFRKNSLDSFELQEFFAIRVGPWDTVVN